MEVTESLCIQRESVKDILFSCEVSYCRHIIIFFVNFFLVG